MGKEKEAPQEHENDLDDLDRAFDDALAGLSDANAKVNELLETMDEPAPASAGAEVDDDGEIPEGDDTPAPEASES